MGVGTRIQDRLSKRTADVTQDHALKVTLAGGLQGSSSGKTPEELTALKQYAGFLADAGGSEDLNVDGSTTPVEFVESSSTSVVKWITTIRVLLNDVGMELDTNDFRDFGDGHTSGLTNGIEFWIEQGGVVTNLFLDPIKSIGQFMDYADSFTNFVNAITAQSDFLSFDFDFQVPIVLPPTVTDRIVMKVQDDLTDVDLFKVVLRGYQELV